MIKKLYLLFLCIWPGILLGQRLDRTVAENYPPDVSLKVLAVKHAIDIDKDTQFELAKLFANEMAAIRPLHDVEEIGEVRQKYALEIKELLGKEATKKYYLYYATKDTLTGANTTPDEQEAYFNAGLDILNEVKPVPEGLKDSLRNTYDRLCVTENGLLLSYNFKLAMQTWVREEDYFYAFHKDKIDDIAWVNAVYYSNWYEQNVKTSKKTTNQIFTTLQERVKATTSLQYTYEGNPKAGQAILEQITNKYDSLVTTYLMKDGVYHSVSTFWLAIENAQYLALSKKQIETLKSKEFSWLLWYHQNSETNFNSWSYERDEFKDGTLTDDQFNKLLVLKNSYAAFEKGKETWNALKEKNLTWQSDSAVVVNQVGGYYTTLFITRDFFENDPAMQESHINAVYALKPEPLKRLENEGKPSGEEEPYRGTFLW